MNNDYKKLYISDNNSMIWGILAGIAEYFETDPTLLRLGYVIITLITGIFPGIITYIIAYFIIPDRPSNTDSSAQTKTSTPTTPPVATIQKEVPNQTTIVEHTPENIGELKKPQWPTITSEPKIEYPEVETPTLDSLMDERNVGLDDLIDE